MEMENEKVTHIRCVKKDGSDRPRHLAYVLATNEVFMNRNGFVIQDVDYDNYLKGLSNNTVVKEVVAEVIEVKDATLSNVIEQPMADTPMAVKVENEVTVPKKRGRKKKSETIVINN